MRTTITIPDELAASARRMSGKRRLSAAIADVIRESESRRHRMELLQFFLENKPPHNWKKIKSERSKRKWSA